MDSILEKQRSIHEERERLHETMVRELLFKRSTHRDQINGDHRLKYLLERFKSSTNELIDLYEDKDEKRKEEIDTITRSSSSEMAEFYNRYKAIKENFKNNPNEQAIPMSTEFDEFLKSRDNPAEANLIDFTDEEGYGKFLDLNENFQQYLNLKGLPKVDYLTYLSSLDKLYEIPKERKLQSDYKKYLESLYEYLYDYCTRVKPLLNLDEILEKYELEQSRQFEIGALAGWQKESSSALSHAGAALDLSGFSSIDELASLGLDRLKSALIALGLKCGGSLQERASRLWATKDRDLTQLPPSMFAKSIGKGLTGKENEKCRDLAMMEVRVYRLLEILAEQRRATEENVQRKQARTAGEREESEDEASQSESDDEQDSEVVYNPKNLPLGWDGKPIPYWLYKLHGLNITYTCEICGNATYKGPKAFQRHFAEWRHAHGMRCLGIPNTAHFANITSIEDAVKLWNKLKEEKQREKFQPLNEEEFEDSEGHVVNKKTYEDLKRQGLL